MTKTLGQVAYEAYYKGGGWEAAAEAVELQVFSRLIDVASETQLAEQAVIEAAKACAAEPDKTLGWADLVAAVEALQEVE